MNPVLRNSAAHVFVESVDTPVLDLDDAHHLFRVLRLRDAECVTVGDGAGRWRPCSVSSGTVVPAGDIVVEPNPRPCHVMVAIPKGDRLDWMVQKLTEIGATEITLVDYARSVVRWTADRVQRNLDRLARISRDASMQSRRAWRPTITGPVSFDVAVAHPGTVLLDPSGQPFLESQTVLIGPEGGFSEAELARDVPRVTLGDAVLRVETAALVAAVRVLTSA